MAAQGTPTVSRVYFVDASFKTLAVRGGMNVKELESLVIDKIELLNAKNYSLFEVSPGHCRALKDHEKPVDVLAKWAPESTKAEAGYFPECYFLFKKRIYFRKKKVPLDKVEVHLQFIQAVDSALRGEHIPTEGEVVTLAALQVQASFGDHSPAMHQVGFLTDKIKSFIPAQLADTRLAQEWEVAIFEEHAKLRGLNEVAAQKAYLDIVCKWDTYGTTYFSVREPTNERRSLVLGVGAAGIEERLKSSKELIHSTPFSSISKWVTSSNMFAYVTVEADKTVKSWEFESTQGLEIASLLQAYVSAILEEYQTAHENQDPNNLEPSDDDLEEEQALVRGDPVDRLIEKQLGSVRGSQLLLSSPASGKVHSIAQTKG